MARIGLNATFTGYTGKLLFRWVESSSPLAEIGRSAAFDFPYSDVFTINDVRPVAHIVEAWRSDDGVALDELIVDWSIDASIFNEPHTISYQYIVDRGSSGTDPAWEDPENLDTELIDERQADVSSKDEIRVHQSGYGDLQNDEFELRTGGGIELTGGKTFDSEVRWSITWHRTLSQNVPPTADQSDFFTEAIVVTADRDVYVDANNHLYDKLVICNKAGSVLTFIFPNLATIPNNTKIFFNTHQGLQKYVKLQFVTGQTINWFGQAKNKVYIAKCEIVGLFFYDGAVYMIKEPQRALLRGKIIPDNDTARGTNSGAYLPADGSIATTLAEADYPGLFEQVEAMPSGTVPLGTSVGQYDYQLTINPGKINEAIVFPNRCYWGIDTVARTLKLPNVKNMSRRFVNTGENPGRYQHDAVGKFEAIPTVPDAYAHTGAPHEAQFTGGNNNNTMHVKGNSKFDTGNTETIMKNYGETPFIVL